MFIGPRDAMLPGKFGASQQAACFQGMLKVIMQFYAVIISQKPSQVSLDSFMDIRGSFFCDFYFSVRGDESWEIRCSIVKVDVGFSPLMLRH